MTDAYLHGVEVVELNDGIRTIAAKATSIIGVVGTAPYADAARFPLDTPVLVTSAAQAAFLKATLPENALINAEGTLPQAYAAIADQARTPIVFIRVAADPDAADQQALMVGAEDERTGVYGLLAAKAMTGAKPKILIAPGFTHQQTGGAANPVAIALKTVAARLRAIVVTDGPSDTDAAAIDKAELEAGDRVYPVEPTVGVLDRTGVIAQRPASAHVAGVIALSDQERGFWWSPSNRPVNGVVSIGRPIEFSLSDPTASSNILNEAGVAVIVNEGGFKLWGNRTPATDGDVHFLAQRRTLDAVFDALEASFLWAMDRPFSAQLLVDIAGSTELYQRELKAQGAMLGGRVWLDEELNTEATFRAGRFYVNVDGEAPAPLDRLTFRFARETGYYAELVSAANQQLA
ncbi:phage tail sheath subtilisin-like domain-containing protein [Brevundimonas vitis]|uniref:Phage tail sheath subtilisin-like domain-containing protein n=1 Tax=Brevundimonas vitisensis TaxID=2800818 RepID=A0ABX7BLZ6_9CAUL|nr:phage tail sheath subtilisin-like domain-containing protein [Brevundimonas vitisensis]QQQ17743.1 phage tail sheath subtilisin-like domain-containing protein [Brevundimonas vitisensis]